MGVLAGTTMYPASADERGIDPWAYWQTLVDWSQWATDLRDNSGDLIMGLAYGALWGKPIIENGKDAGRTPGLVFEGMDEASARFQNIVLLNIGGYLYHPVVFGKGIVDGLINELTGLWDLLKSVANGTLFTMINEAMNAIASDPAAAFKLGEGIGGGMVEKIGKAVEGPFEGFVKAAGEFLGSILLDIVAAFFSGGGATLAKGGAKVVTRVAKTSAELAQQIAQKGRKQLENVRHIMDDVADSLSPMPAMAGGPGRMPRPPRNAMGPNRVFSVAEDASSTAGRGLSGGARGGGSHVPKPSAAPAGSVPAGSKFNIGRAKAGGTSTAAASRVGRKVINVPQVFTESAQAIRRQKRSPKMPPPRPKGWKPDPTLSSHPDVGPTLELIRGGRKLPEAIRDLRPLMVDMIGSAGAGGIRAMSGTIAARLYSGEVFGGFDASFRSLLTHSSAILQRRPIGANGRMLPRGRFPNYNRGVGWTEPARQFRELILPQLRDRLNKSGLSDDVKAGLLADLNRRWNAAHSLGPGMGDETALGMGFTADWINQKVQAGVFRNDVLGIVTRRDPRRSHGGNPNLVNPHAAEVAGTRYYDGYGVEGIIIDFERAVQAGAKSGRFPPNSRVHLDTFTESWGDELLATDMFQIAKDVGVRLKPQQFVRAVEYRARTVVAEGGRFVEVPDLSMAFRLDIAPPPFFSEARVTVLGKAAGAIGPGSATTVISRRGAMGR